MKVNAKPFIKWVGGKGQLLAQLDEYLPEILNEREFTYFEPFVGGGAMLFYMLQKYPNIERAIINDINPYLITAYRIIKDEPEELIERLSILEEDYFALESEDAKKNFFLNVRTIFNEDDLDTVDRTKYLMFLNRTCFNGLYRVNRKGEYNVPMGAYQNPLICNEHNLKAVSKKLQNVKIVCGDYKESGDFIDDKTFVYFDPPYRPLTPTANFTSYTEGMFDDKNQLELAKFVQELDKKGAKIVASNSDPKNTNEDDNFFDDAYAKQNIKRVSATRMINRNSDKRGKINELLISNF